MPKLALIVNSHSGGGNAHGAAGRFVGLYRAAGVEPAVHAANGAELGELTKHAIAAGAKLVVAAGGDGTVSTVAGALAGTAAALGVIPLGTLNHFARDLGIPLDIAAAVVNTLQGRPHLIDAGEVNGRLFLNNSSIGLYPAMVYRRAKQQRRLGRGKWQAMLWAAHTVLSSHPFMDLTLALAGRLTQARDFEGAITARLRIESRHARVLVATDGEVATFDMPLEYRIRPQALRVMGP